MVAHTQKFTHKPSTYSVTCIYTHIQTHTHTYADNHSCPHVQLRCIDQSKFFCPYLLTNHITRIVPFTVKSRGCPLGIVALIQTLSYLSSRTHRHYLMSQPSIADTETSSNSTRSSSSPYAPRFAKTTDRGAKRVLKSGAIASARKKLRQVGLMAHPSSLLIFHHSSLIPSSLIPSSHIPHPTPLIPQTYKQGDLWQISDSQITKIDEHLFSCIRTVVAGRHFFLDKVDFIKVCDFICLPL